MAANPRKSIFEKCLNPVLIADSESTQKTVRIRTGILDFRLFCVELWPKQVLHRILVPMSYISFVVNVNENGNVSVNENVNVNATYRCVPKVDFGAKYLSVVIIGFEGAKIF